jgi:glutamine synthetase adenylyltransferase
MTTAYGQYGDKQLIEASPFLRYLVGEGRWQESGGADSIYKSDDPFPSARDFRRKFRQMLDDPESALLALRRFRLRSLLALAKADLEDRVRPHQIRARLRVLSETMVQSAWWAAEDSLRERYVHPLILERRNINPPMAICSLSRLGAGEPWYTTGPAPIFIHSRAAEYSPALTEKDFFLARRAGKQWLPARDYFHRLARRTLSFLSVPDAAGKGFDHMAEDVGPHEAPLLPGALVVLFSAFESHFLQGRPVKERLSLLRLRFLVGQEKLGRAVEHAARMALLKTADELGSRLRSGVNAWYRDRAKAEGLPMARGGLLDIERVVRLAQFRQSDQDPDILVPSVLKGLEKLTAAGAITGDERLVLQRSYGFQWFLANRMSLLGRREELDWESLRTGRMDNRLGLPGAGEKLRNLTAAARSVLLDLARETRREASS